MDNERIFSPRIYCYVLKADLIVYIATSVPETISRYCVCNSLKLQGKFDGEQRSRKDLLQSWPPHVTYLLYVAASFAGIAGNGDSSGSVPR